MPKLITLGCSFTYLDGLRERLAELLNYENVNFSTSAGTNLLQVHKFQEYILNNKLDVDDIIVWQVTYSSRNGLRVGPNTPLSDEALKIERKMFYPLSTHFDKDNKNVFDNLERYDLLQRSPIVKEKDILLNFDENDQLQTLLSTIIMASKFHKKLLVMFGNNDVLTKENRQTFEDYLNKHNVNYIDESFVSWVFRTRLDFRDPVHPSSNAGMLFAEKVLYQRMVELKWI